MQPPSAVFAFLVNEVVRERRAMSTEMAMRLGRLFGTSAECWLNVQLHVVVHDALFVGAVRAFEHHALAARVRHDGHPVAFAEPFEERAEERVARPVRRLGVAVVQRCYVDVVSRARSLSGPNTIMRRVLSRDA